MYCFIDNEITKKEDSKISVFDRSFLYGENIFETFIQVSGIIIDLKSHLSRLCDGLNTIGIENRINKEMITKNIEKLIKKNGYKKSILKIIVSGGISDRGLIAENRNGSRIVIIEEELKIDEAKYKDGINLNTQILENNSRSVKSGGLYLAKILMLNNSKSRELLFVDRDDNILETTVANIFFIRNSTLYFSNNKQKMLFGITAEKTSKIAKEKHLQIEIGELKLSDAIRSDEAFITNSVFGIMPVSAINNHKFLQRKISATLSQAYWEEYEEISPF